MLAVSDSLSSDLEFRQCKHDDEPKVARKIVKKQAEEGSFEILVCKTCDEILPGESMPL